ncbi:MAG: F0F1 ATP synthase subunit A [Deltaproteobacteria bacterium]|nr:F0F1 ATP synthase subunit A [Deltaproteobacteria bacterium]
MVHPFLVFEWLANQIHINLGPHVIYGWLIAILLIVLAWRATRNLTESAPSGLQNFMEVVIEGLEKFIEENAGPKGKEYFPLFATLALFILSCNLIALVPGCYPPTANVNTNLAMALTVFGATHYIGIKEHGFKYIKHFMGPVLPLAPLIFIIEVISHIARPISLTLRLFGNMYGHEMVLMVFLALVPLFVPLPMMLMGIMVAFIQTFVFTLLSIIYISGAIEEAH